MPVERHIKIGRRRGWLPHVCAYEGTTGAKRSQVDRSLKKSSGTAGKLHAPKGRGPRLPRQSECDGCPRAPAALVVSSHTHTSYTHTTNDRCPFVKLHSAHTAGLPFGLPALVLCWVVACILPHPPPSPPSLPPSTNDRATRPRGMGPFERNRANAGNSMSKFR